MGGKYLLMDCMEFVYLGNCYWWKMVVAAFFWLTYFWSLVMEENFMHMNSNRTEDS